MSLNKRVKELTWNQKYNKTTTALSRLVMQDVLDTNFDDTKEITNFNNFYITQRLKFLPFPKKCNGMGEVKKMLKSGRR